MKETRRSTPSTAKQGQKNERSQFGLVHSNQWQDIVFPIETTPLTKLLATPFTIFDSGRSTALIGTWPDGEQGIFALQSAKYSLIPNQIFQNAADTVLGPEHNVLIRYSRKGDFQINLVLPEVIAFQEGNQKDLLQRQITILNSYTGKSQIHLQATELKRVMTQRVRVSYYRQVCTNGLMGWASEYFTMDEYLTYLVTGERPVDRRWKNSTVPQEYLKSETTLENVEERELSTLLKKSFTHRGLDTGAFYTFLCEFLTNAILLGKEQPDLTLSVFDAMSQKRVVDKEKAQELLIDASLPQKLAKAAIQQMEAEAIALETTPNAWLLYNGANHALFNQQSSIPLDERYSLDKKMFDAVNLAYLVN